MKHHPAAFINAIAEEGTKDEAVEWLQKTWNELCEAKVRIKELEERVLNADDEARVTAETVETVEMARDG